MRTIPAAVLAACVVVAPSSSFARPGGWGGSGWGGGYGAGWNDPPIDRPVRSMNRSTSRSDPREGRIQVSRFITQDLAGIDQLGHGAVAVSSLAGPGNDSPVATGTRDYLAQGARAPFEAAVLDRLVALGYDTMHADPTGGQVAELRVTREVLVPGEIKRSPVSGTAAMEVGTRGSAYGLGINVDMTKPRSALLSTRLDARIKDRATGKILWEGNAQIATREGDDRWTDGAVATRLAEALFDDFRQPTG
ncbi:hypothetical protein HNO88_000537 [Novosphingobium chloroacetimidivorans]|uniref:DUF4136 domain-containing protein n=1 Tax=Novosphingobium chloroacetimidivorans TaxID=1428314 RepID=A0A7W7K6N3_9SPHN|nr:hypothetical protein [Novosphingobium chloroacetimidivorans]MBB4857230.1 hypothetical protein [Novosphingobium chloroacetimidivorans]